MESTLRQGDMGNRFGIRDGKVVPENILDDQSMVIQTVRGIFIVLGCAHSGMINVIAHAIQVREKTFLTVHMRNAYRFQPLEKSYSSLLHQQSPRRH